MTSPTSTTPDRVALTCSLSKPFYCVIQRSMGQETDYYEMTLKQVSRALKKGMPHKRIVEKEKRIEIHA